MQVARLTALVVGGFALVAAVAGAGLGAPSPAVGSSAPPALASAALSGVIVRPGVIHVGRALASAPITAVCEKDYQVACYQPAQIQQAYNLPALYASGVTGRGTTIVIVDSYGSPTIKNDLGVFDKTFNLPAPPSFTIIQPEGKVPAYDPASSDMVGWAGETTLDVEYAHSVAPGANILLVETPVAETEGVHGFPQIVAAEQYVIEHHLGDVISQSFSATEESFNGGLKLIDKYNLRTAYERAAHDGVTVLTASGDSGAADVGLDGETYYTTPV